uniref:phosphoenolpyruvate carboxylase n=2 Tax=Sargassum TaxID=3015 RepID=A0A097IUC2_9PHAE|nr:phosphoenolpyruvate carboxylase [Sargassum henslowianum]AIT70055.1 phosphoenolpyruvate carboxylase [Sargassum vachellianum]
MAMMISARGRRSALTSLYNLSVYRPALVAASGKILRRPLSTEKTVTDTLDHRLRRDVRMLGGILGETINKHSGKEIFNHVEELRYLAQALRSGETELSNLAEKVKTLSAEEILGVSKGFAHFFALANTADNHHRVRSMRESIQASKSLGVPRQEDSSLGTIENLLKRNIATPDEIIKALGSQKAELVLTAHPTEINRRTLLAKHRDVAKRLEVLEQIDLAGGAEVTGRFEADEAVKGLTRAVEALWTSDEVRRNKPTPQDEARAGIAVIEHVLWAAVPSYLRRLDGVLMETMGKTLPIHACPIAFASWMGGDRDGNPNVTPEVTREVSFTARKEAAILYLRDVRDLRIELSTTKCTPELREIVGETREPYRKICSQLEHDLSATVDALQGMVDGHLEPDVQALPIHSQKQILEPLLKMHESLLATGQEAQANGPIVDVIRRVRCFGVCLAPLDIRQESTRHTEALDAITRYLGVGSYAQWDEKTRQSWLLMELQSKRPLLPRLGSSTELGLGEVVQDTLRTFEVAATLGEEALGAYVISMATSPSDVLAVKLMQKEFCMPWNMRVVPLFETLDDLEQSEDTIRTLLGLPWYRGNINGKQEVMIGYSDSAKDAGRMAAAWAQYKAQERLAGVAEDAGVQLTFFHGKGGTVSRGGNPALYEAIMAQPRGTVNGHFRVTEQGEMITQNFGHPGIAVNTLDTYTAGILHYGFEPPAVPSGKWRKTMDRLSEVSCEAYRDIVRRDERFVPYFRTATPELELGSLNIGSRPAKRRPTGGVETLRAIPWVFSWTQTRLNLPAWLGVADALSELASTDDGKATLRSMYDEWPFFATNIDLFETILAKSDVEIAEHYDKELVSDVKAKELGAELRRRLQETSAEILKVSERPDLIAYNEVLRWQLVLRKPYLDPVNVMQAHILHRLRSGAFGSLEEEQHLKDALVITIKGIAGGMRNTG